MCIFSADPTLQARLHFLPVTDWIHGCKPTGPAVFLPAFGESLFLIGQKKNLCLKENTRSFCTDSQLITLLTSVLLNPGYLINPPHLLLIFQDTVIYERLAETSKYKEITLKHLEQFATEGECYMNRTWLKHEEIMDFWYLVGSLAVPLPDFLDEVLVIDDSLDIPMH